MSVFSKNTRTGRFFRTLSSSYVLLLAATVYSLGVVPIILTYVGTAKLGLWSLIVQFGTYLTLLDAGLSNTCIRQFVGPVVRKDPRDLNEKFQNALVLASVQGIFIAVGGLAGGILVLWLGIPPEQAADFRLLFLAQCGLVAVEFPFRPFNALLLARQRFEFSYLCTAVGMILSLGVVGLGMRGGLGLWSLVLAGAFQAMVKISVALFCVSRFWGIRGFFSCCHVRLETMRRLLAESGFFFSGTFFGTLGGMAQSTLLSRWFGLDGVAAWSVGSKVANLLSQLLSKFYESSFAGLSELFESGRLDVLVRRLGQLYGWVMGLSLFCATGVCFFNGDFVRLWTGARVDWPPAGDWVVALWLVGLTASRGLAEQAKILLVWRWIRLGPATEFVVWALLCFPLIHLFSMTGFILSMAIAPLVSSGMTYWAGLRSKYRQVPANLISQDAASFYFVGIALFLFAVVLGPFIAYPIQRLLIWSFAMLMVGLFFLPRIRKIISTIYLGGSRIP